MEDYELDIIRNNDAPYLCNSIFCIRTDTYKKIVEDNTLYVDSYEEVPLNKYCWKNNMNHLFVKNGFAIHMYYNWKNNHINSEKIFCDAFFNIDKKYELNRKLKNIVNNKIGVEIGGPSETGEIIYQNSNNIDNVVFSQNTIWINHENDYNYYPGKKGKTIINDAVDISLVENETYDFCFSSHCLEHIANPLKAISEWLRIIKKDGYIIIIVPEKSVCFDHNRNISLFSTLLSQYEKNVSEYDLSTLPEILQNHDLSMDYHAGNLENFARRSLDNYNNRCLHHYVYNPDLLKEICNYFKCEFIHTITDGINIWFIMKKQ